MISCFINAFCQSILDDLRLMLGSAPIMAFPAMLQKWPPEDPEIAFLDHVDSYIRVTMP